VSPRKASLRVAHAKACRNATKTTLDSLKGCNCQPSYYVFHRDRDGAVVKSQRVKDRAVADKLLRDAQRDLDEGRVGLKREQNITFDEWADMYEEILKAKNLKARTVDGYKAVIDRARDVFGTSWLREIGNSELRRFDKTLGKVRPASRLRYYRELSACFSQALKERKGWLGENPVPPFVATLNLRKPKRGKAPFETEELPRLYAELEKDDDKVYLYAARFSAEAGLRLGELIGLEWQDVSLLDKPRITVARQYDGITPKSGKARRFRLTKEAAQVLEEWIEVTGARSTGKVFPLSAQVLQDRVESARKAAGIPKLSPDPGMVDEQGNPLKRSFHSLRFSCAALMLNRGYPFEAVMATTGHSRQELTEMYGAQSEAMLDAMYDRVEQPN
jgi:integrase